MRSLLVAMTFAALPTALSCTPSATPAMAPAPLAGPPRVAADSGPAEEVRTLRGSVHTTKGAQLMLSGVIIPDNVLPPSTTEKRRARHDWLGKRVELRGLVKRYVCRPMEQCLIGGSIPFVKRIDSLRVLAPSE